MLAQNPGTGYTIWITGMQGAGKRSLAKEIANRLRRLERNCELLDSPDWEPYVGKGPGSTKEERIALVKRAAFIARAITRAGGFALVPMISPFREPREQARRDIGRFLEVFVDCPFETLIARDTTGQYQKALRGEIRNFIGVTDPYEPPSSPEVKVDTSKMSVDEAASLVIEALVREGSLSLDDVGLDRAPRAGSKKKGGRTPEPPPDVQYANDAEMVQRFGKAKPVPVPRVAPSAKPPPTPLPVAAKAPAKAPPAPATSAAKPGAKAVPAPAKAAPVPVKPAAKAAPVPAKPAAKAAPVPAKPAAKAAPIPAKAPAKAAPVPAKAPAKPVPAKAAARPAPVPAKAKAPAKPAPRAVAKPATKAPPAKKPAAKVAPPPVRGKTMAKPAHKADRVAAKPPQKNKPLKAPTKVAAKTVRAAGGKKR